MRRFIYVSGEGNKGLGDTALVEVCLNMPLGPACSLIKLFLVKPKFSGLGTTFLK
jgi:hypothetical protein